MALSTRKDTAAMVTIYFVCECCGHIDPRPAHDDRVFKCENCGHRNACPFEIDDQAFDYSEEVIERNAAYDRTLRGELAGGW